MVDIENWEGELSLSLHLLKLQGPDFRMVCALPKNLGVVFFKAERLKHYMLSRSNL